MRYQKELLCLFVLLLGINQAESLSAEGGVLHAETRNKIEGSAPYFVSPDGTKLSSLDELLSITMPRRDGGEGRETIIASMSDKFVAIPKGMKYSDVKLVFGGKADGKTYNLKDLLTLGDEDGDTGNIDGSVRASWYLDGSAVSVSDLENEINQDDCGGLYELRITIPRGTRVSARTSYGYPSGTRERLYYSGSSDKEVVYQFESARRKICYLRPFDMGFSYKETGQYPGKKYNPEVFVPNYGFKVNSGFPTTGFKGAKFILKGSGNNQSRYRCSSPNGKGKVSLSGSASASQGLNCEISYAALTKEEFIAGGTPLIKMEYEESKDVWKELGSYQIPIPKKWAIDMGNIYYARKDNIYYPYYYPALDVCRGVPMKTTKKEEALGESEEARALRLKYLYGRNEMIDSYYYDPIRYLERQSEILFYSRDLGAFIGEWGVRPSLNSLWLGEVKNSPYSIGSNEGGYYYLKVTSYSSTPLRLLCRGD